MSSNKWRAVQLGELLNFRRGHDLPKTKMKAGKIPVVASNGIIGFHNEITTKVPCLTIGRSGNIGNPIYINQDCWAHNTTLYVDDYKGNDPKYLYYLLKTLNLEYYGGGSAVPTLNRNHIHPIEVNATLDIVEQQAIANILFCLDDKIELNNKINKALEEIAQAIFKDLFVNFQPFQDDEFEDSELGRIPKGWRVGCLEEITKQVHSVCRRSEIPIGSRYVGLEHIPKKQLVINEYGSIEAVISDKLRFEKFNILFGKIRPYFHKVSIAPWDGYCSTDAIVLTPKSEGYYGYMALTLYSDLFVQFAVKVSQGTKMPRAEWKVLKNFKMVIPPIEIVKNFNMCFSPMIKKMILNSEENGKLTHIRDALLPKLMSGEIRVPIEEVQ